MAIVKLSIPENYWENFEITESDLEYLYNQLLELETPQTPQELIRMLISERIRLEKKALESKQLSKGKIYTPKDTYKPGEKLVFTALDWHTGKVISTRNGQNPMVSDLKVIEVSLDNGETRSFASNLQDHILNQPAPIDVDDPLLNEQIILKRYGSRLLDKLNKNLESNSDLVRIAGRWFPRALLVDVNIGHLNLAEAVLDMAGGGPLTTRSILEQVELPSDSNIKLTEFSLNLALQEDGRFDEVGPSGEILWYLRRLEPEGVQNIPSPLKWNNVPINREAIQPLLQLSQTQIVDELEPELPGEETSEISLSLIYPHWRAGTLPLIGNIKSLFPTAYESPRVQFRFIDSETKHSFSGWVVRSSNYVFGLRDWYVEQSLFPGSILTIKKSLNAGEVIISANKKRPTREWVRTALVGTDGGIVFAMLKQIISSTYDERMATILPDTPTIDGIWDQTIRQRIPLEQTIITLMRELSKLNPQGHVHGLELYSVVNLVRRCPPSQIFTILNERPWSNYLGDLYFRLEESVLEGKTE